LIVTKCDFIATLLRKLAFRKVKISVEKKGIWLLNWCSNINIHWKGDHSMY